MPLGLPAALERLEQTLRPFQLFVLLQQDRHDDGLERPQARDHNPCLDVELGAIEESIEDGLIGFGERPFERCPTAAWDMRRSDILIPYAGQTPAGGQVPGPGSGGGSQRPATIRT